jgi:hypothetical protein
MKSAAIFLRLIILTLSGLLFVAAGLYSSKAADNTTDNYNVTMNDGTILVGAIQIKKVTFNANYGATDVSMGDVVSFSGGFLTLNDGSKLKGSFSNGNLTLETARGEMNLPFASISSITKSSAVTAAVLAPASPTISSSGSAANLAGKVFDCFGKPLAGVSVAVQNTRFSTTTDEQGNYSLGYVPGTIQVSYNKDGYYATNLTFQIATPSPYPVQDLLLFKELPDKGIFFIGENDYVKSFNSIQMKNSESKQFSWTAANTENQYFVTGAAISIDNSDHDFRFVFNNENGDSPATTVLFRVQSGSPFLRRVQYGLGNIKLLGDQINSGTVSQIGNFKLWTGHLNPGYYLFVTEYNPELDNYTSFAEPCLYFSVGNGTGVSSDRAMANPSGSLPTTDSNDSVIAKGNGFEIKRSQLDEVMTGMKSAAAAHGQTIPPDQINPIQIQMLNRLIHIQLLLQKATDADKADGKKKADEQLSELLDKAGSQETLDQQLKAVGMTADELRSKVMQEATATAALTRELGVTVTDVEVKEFYDGHPSDFLDKKSRKLALTDKVPSTDMTVADKIKDYLTQQKTEKLAPPYLDNLGKNAGVEILDPDLK